MQLIAVAGREIVGVTISKKHMRAVRADGFLWHVCDVGRKDFPAEDASVDTPVFGRMLRHMARPALVLRRNLCMLKPGGRVYALPWGFLGRLASRLDTSRYRRRPGLFGFRLLVASRLG